MKKTHERRVRNRREKKEQRELNKKDIQRDKGKERNERVSKRTKSLSNLQERNTW